MTTEKLIQLDCNIDDSTPEILSYAAERLLKAGALDVWMTPIIMKKGRPAIMLSVLTKPQMVDTLAELLYNETSTIGIRQIDYLRKSLPWKILTVNTSYGELDVKIVCMNNKIVTISLEFETCRKAAEKYKKPLHDIYEAALEAGRKGINGCPKDINY